MRSVHSFIRHTGIAAAVVALAGAGLVAAPPASATPIDAECGDADTTASITLSPGGTFQVKNAGSEICELGGASVVLNSPSFTILTSATATYTIKSNASAGDYVITFKDDGLGGGPAEGLTLTITVVAGGGGGGSAAPVSVPVAMSLSLGADAGGAVCAEDSVEQGMSGTWMRLPAQGDCSLPSRPGAKLLGWATSASFPVAIAQRQADHMWGTYEMVDADGTVTAIFIPAGWATFVTNANNLYPIWSA